MSTEITKGMLQKFDVAYMIFKPALRPTDILDAELMLVSDKIPVLIKGYLTIAGDGRFEPRVYTSGHNMERFTISEGARRKLRLNMSRLIAQVRGELLNG